MIIKDRISLVWSRLKKNFVLCVCFGLMVTSAAAQETDTKSKQNEVTIGKKYSITSDILGEERTFYVYLPVSYNDSMFTPQNYPVLYLLDGENYFHSASGVVEFMSIGNNGNIQIPEMIIVAITNTDRIRDMTPTHTLIEPDGGKADQLKTSGGGSKFLRFIQNELFPEIDKTYRTLPYRIIAGHSFGGLFALHALLDSPKMFQGYIAIDPSLWWDNGILVNRVKDRFKQPQDPPMSVYISKAKHPALPGRGPREMKMWDKAIGKFANTLETYKPLGIRSTLQYFEEEDHTSVPLLSLYHGLLYIFRGYKPSPSDFLEQPASLNTHFEDISEQLGVTFKPPEPYVNRQGYFMLYRIGDVNSAIELFKLNVSNFPESYNAYDSLGEAYMVKGDTLSAIKYYQKSLELNPDNQNLKNRLKFLNDHPKK